MVRNELLSGRCLTFFSKIPQEMELKGLEFVAMRHI